MYYRASEAGPWRSKRGTSDVENANRHINGVLSAPGPSCELAHCLFTDALGRRNIRMAINNGDFSVEGLYELRRLRTLISSCNVLKEAGVTVQLADVVDAKSQEYLSFFDKGCSNEQFGFYTSFPATAPRGPITIQVVHHEQELLAGMMSWL